jgi:RNA-splicing ligase RtcB
MLVYKAKHNVAKVFIDIIDEETVKQIYNFLNHPAFADSKIRIMPDTHAGKGSVIGFTMTMNNYIIPNVVGVDIGCGMLMHKLDAKEIDFIKLDEFIKNEIPSGFSVQNQKGKDRVKKELYEVLLDIFEVTSIKVEQTVDAIASLGTLGGGNHFIEIDKHGDDYYLVVHTGSRNFGLSICNYHQKKAKALMNEMFIGDAYKNLEFLPMDKGGNDYLKDMYTAQDYAIINRKLIVKRILKDFFKQEPDNSIECVHNYIGKDNIIRKGAISAQAGEKVIIPLNMRDGVIVGTGKGNADWNFSAPHGAGRILSRKKAKEELTIEEFKTSMEGIYTSCVNGDTLDESPMAYKDSQLIIDAIGETVDIDFIMKPVYNFKAGGE